MRKLVLPALAAGLLNAAGFVVDQNLVLAAGALVGTVGLTLSVVAWIDKRIAIQIAPLKIQLQELKTIVLRSETAAEERDYGYPKIDK